MIINELQDTVYHWTAFAVGGGFSGLIIMIIERVI